jgi:NAD(P)-dependent dehydrogenase (short-subunit alcohol dehydrogenase family)
MTLGWAAEYADAGVAANCLWPETLIATAAVQNVVGGEEAIAKSRTPVTEPRSPCAPPRSRAGQARGACSGGSATSARPRPSRTNAPTALTPRSLSSLLLL